MTVNTKVSELATKFLLTRLIRGMTAEAQKAVDAFFDFYSHASYEA